MGKEPIEMFLAPVQMVIKPVYAILINGLDLHYQIVPLMTNDFIMKFKNSVLQSHKPYLKCSRLTRD